jgi:hypothetical protein
MTALFVLVWITKRQRSRKVPRRHTEQFPESSPVIGLRFGTHNKSRHTVKDLKKGPLPFVHKHQNKEHLQTKEPLEKLHEEIKRLQYEVIKHRRAEVRFDQKLSELMADNEGLHAQLDKFEQAEPQIAEMTAADRLLQPEDHRAGQVEKISAQQVVAEPAVEVPVKRKTAGRSKAYEQRHRTVGGVAQKLCQKCKEWKPESEFHKDSSSRDSLAASCKICKNNAAREYRRRRKAAQR